jgi:elongation factor Ts
MDSIDLIKKLRLITNAPVMDIKKVLDDVGHDADKAIKKLQAIGAAKAAQKSLRETRSGLVHTHEHLGKIGVVVEVNCETDFVAKNDDFKSFVHDVALHIASMSPVSIDELLKQEFVKDTSKTMAQLLHELIGKIGENIVIRRFERYELGE